MAAEEESENSEVEEEMEAEEEVAEAAVVEAGAEVEWALSHGGASSTRITARRER